MASDWLNSDIRPNLWIPGKGRKCHPSDSAGLHGLALSFPGLSTWPKLCPVFSVLCCSVLCLGESSPTTQEPCYTPLPETQPLKQNSFVPKDALLPSHLPGAEGPRREEVGKCVLHTLSRCIPKAAPGRLMMPPLTQLPRSSVGTASFPSLQSSDQQHSPETLLRVPPSAPYWFEPRDPGQRVITLSP